MNLNFIKTTSVFTVCLLALGTSAHGLTFSNRATTAPAASTAPTSNTASDNNVVQTQGLPAGGIRATNPDATTTATATVGKPPDLSDFKRELNLAELNSIKITNVDLFSAVSDTDVGDIYSIYSIANLKPENAGCATIIDGEIIFIAAKGFKGTAVIDYTVMDGEGHVSDVEQITIDVVNKPKPK